MKQLKPTKPANSRKGRKPFWYEGTRSEDVDWDLLPQHLYDLYAHGPTGFENDTFWMHATWLSEKQLRDPGLRAVVEADKADSPDPVIAFLKSDQTISGDGRAWIADWLQRHKGGKTGPKAIPAYALSLQDAVRLIAKERADELIEDGIDRDRAYQFAAGEFGLQIETLIAFAEGKLGSSNRMKRRRAAAPNRRATGAGAKRKPRPL